MGCGMPDYGFGRCDGHHKTIDFRLKKAPACACFTSHGRRRHRSIEHVAGVDDFEVAEATWLAAVKRWPKAPLFCVKVRESCMTAADPE